MLRHRLDTIRDIVVGGPLVLGHVLASPLLRHRYNRSGATIDEVEMAMPGDRLVARPQLSYTRAITVDAPPDEVWPWLVQIGQGRGGLYSFDGLENLLRCGIHSADTILAEHQELKLGDLVRSGPDEFPCWAVMEVEPKRHLVLIGAGTPANFSLPEFVGDVPAPGHVASTWQWMLRPDGEATRLIVRQRLAYSGDQHRRWRLVEPIHYVMEREMLRGIKARAEQRLGATRQRRVTNRLGAMSPPHRNRTRRCRRHVTT